MTTREHHKKFVENQTDYNYQEDRGLIMRVIDEVRSWFGDEQAEERRRIDYLLNEQRCREKLYLHKQYDLEKVRAHEIMTRSVIAVQPDDTVQRAAQLMTDSNCGALPVVDNSNRLIGIVTDRDLTVRSTSLGIDPRQAQIEECMTHGSFACHATDTLKDCMLHMSRHQIRRLPIINDHTQVIGILSQADLARYIGAYPERGMRNAMADVLSAVSEPTYAPYR
jgi:signal-transduction protein with cAMP-binding, CBS, and nucleotidyltransferase domain